MTEKVIRVRVDSGNSTQEINNLNKSMQGLGASADAAGAKSGKFSQVMGQAGFQVQDFIVQVQGGTSAITAFTQQAPQLAGAFGPGGAVAGALLALGGVIAGTFLTSLTNSKTALERLQTAVENLGGILEKNASGVTVYADAIDELRQQSERAAQLALSVALYEQEQALKAAGEALGDLSDEFADFFGRTKGRVFELTGVKEGEEDFRFLQRTIAELKTGFEDFAKSPSIGKLDELERKLKILTDSGRISSEDLALIVKTFNEIATGARKAGEGVELLSSVIGGNKLTGGVIKTKEEVSQLDDEFNELLATMSEVSAFEAKMESDRLKAIASFEATAEKIAQQTELMKQESAIRQQLISGEITQEQANQEIGLNNLIAYYTARRQAIIDNIEYGDEEKRALILQLNLQEQIAAELQEQRLTGIKEKGAKDRERIAALEAKQTRDMLINTAVTAFNLMQNSNQKMTKEQKKQAKRSVYIQTAAAIARAYGENNFYVASAMAVFLAAMQLRQINAIETATGSGGTAAAPTLSAGTSGGNQTKFINITGIDQNSLISGAQLAEILKTDDDVVVSFANGLDDAKRRGVISG